jgi:hypothetical protein
MTRKQLEKSSLKEELHTDKSRQQLLEPLYPKGLRKETNSPAIK